MHSDADLYRRWLEAHDERAFADLARRHANLVFDVAWRAGGDRHLAEDALQEALLRLASDGTDRPLLVGVRAWLARLAISKALNARASSRARTRRERKAAAQRAEARMTDEADKAREAVAEALALCKRDDAALLSMRHVHGLAYGELAAVLGVAEATARVRVHRALVRLRKTVRQNDLDERALAGLVAAVPPHTASAAAVESMIAAAVGGTATATAGAATLTVAPWIPRALAVAGLALLAVGSAGLLWWAFVAGRSEVPSPRVERAAAPEATGETTLRGRSVTGAGETALATVPGETVPAAKPTWVPPAPEKALPDLEIDRALHPADGATPLRVRLLLVHADGTEEKLPITEIAHCGATYSGEALDRETLSDVFSFLRMRPGRIVTFATRDDRAAFRRISAVVPELPAEIVIRIPETGTLASHDLALEVVDAESGQPIPEASLEWGSGAGRAARVPADRSGRIPVRIPEGASWGGDDEPLLLRFDAAECVVHAPGYFAFGDPWGMKESVPCVRARDLATWMERGIKRIALEPIPEDTGLTERTVRILDAEGRPAEGAYVLVIQPVLREYPFFWQRPQDGFRRADEEGRLAFPMSRAVGLEVRVDRVPVAAWALSDEAWPEDGHRVLRLPPIAEAELVVKGLPEGTGRWARDPLGAKRTPRDDPAFPAVYDPQARALLDRKNAVLPAMVVDMARGDLVSPRSTMRLPLPVGQEFTLHLWAGGEHRTWAVKADEPGPLRLTRAWNDLPKAP